MSIVRVYSKVICLSMATLSFSLSQFDYAQAADAPAPIVIGLDADMSAGAAQSGEAIRRGAVLALDEINNAGGVLGRRIELVIRDHRGNPARGIDNINEFSEQPGLVAVLGGSHTPVALAELEAIHRHKIIYLDPWAAGTPITDNGYVPNFVFRVSVRDELAGGFLVEKALERGLTKIGLLLWRTGWGRSNEQAMVSALAQRGLEPAGIEWFNTSAPDMSQQIDRLVARGADVIMLVSTANDGVTVVRNMAQRPSGNRLPIISHWGIAAGAFYNKAADDIAKVDLTFLQTFSFVNPPVPDKAKRLLRSYCAKFRDCGAPANIKSPLGTAHAYDLIHLLRLAIEKAGTIDREKVRAALESLDRYEGLMREYAPPFTVQRHDALDRTSFQLSQFSSNGGIVPTKAN